MIISKDCSFQHWYCFWVDISSFKELLTYNELLNALFNVYFQVSIVYINSYILTNYKWTTCLSIINPLLLFIIYCPFPTPCSVGIVNEFVVTELFLNLDIMRCQLWYKWSCQNEHCSNLFKYMKWHFTNVFIFNFILITWKLIA